MPFEIVDPIRIMRKSMLCGLYRCPSITVYLCDLCYKHNEYNRRLFPQSATDELQKLMGTKWDQDSYFDI